MEEKSKEIIKKEENEVKGLVEFLPMLFLLFITVAFYSFFHKRDKK